MLQIDNKTPFAASIALFANEQGIDSLYVMTRASFITGDRWTLAAEQVPPQEADEYFGEPILSSLSAVSDYHIGKIGTDLIVLGSACAKEGQAVRALDVSLQVGSIRKVIRVFGDRYWDGGKVSHPDLFESLPLIYERAYGGSHFDGDTLIVSDTRNPIGQGFLGQRSLSDLDGTALPNLEDPRYLIQTPKDSPVPACFGFVSPNWQPRVDYAGTYDEEWQIQRAPFLPADFNRRFLNSAHPDLVTNTFLRGGETVKISNMHPKGELNFQLPVINLKCRVDVAGKLLEVPSKLETVIFEPNDLKVSMVWKSEIVCDKKAQKIREISLSLAK